MEENAYVLLDLESIKVNIKETTTDPIVFCESIQVKLHETQDISLIDDWSNIIIGNPGKYKELEGVTEVAIAKFDEITDEYTGGINTGIGLWSVILFETIKNEEGEYTGLTIDNMGSGGIGGAGEQESNIKEVYENTLTSINYTVNDCVYNFLENIFNTEKYNGCIFINNNDCGLFLNISPKMFNEQENLKSIALTNTIIYIGDKGASSSGVFSNCINLESANIPTHLDNYFEYNINNNTYDKLNTTRKVPSYYFYNCNKLNNILIPDGIHNIEYAAFYGCDSVETINIPSSVTSVFSNSLLTVKRANTRYINVNGDATNKTNITFYNKCIGYNKPTTGDKTYVVNSVVISINNRDTVNLMGSNNINDTSFIDNIGGGSKIYIDCGTINGVKIGNTINSTTRFYYGGFIGTSFDTIYIGPTVSKICDFAFYNVKNTTNLIINNDTVLKTLYDTKDEDDIIKENVYPDGTYLIRTPFVKSNFNNIDILNCTTIGEYALHNIICNDLTFYEQDVSLEINDNLTITNTTTLETLSNYAFYNSHFGSITIPSTVTSNDINNTNISNTAFLQTTGSLVLNCDISKYETKINQNSRTGILVNSGFSKINFNYANSIPANVLYENEHIQLIELSEGITSISTKAFYLCTNLSGILTIPSTLTEISNDAFIGCRFNEFISSSDTHYRIAESGMYLLKGSNIVLFANRHAGIQIVNNTFDIINIEGVTGIGDYAFAYAFSDNSNSTVLAVNIPTNIKNFGSNVFYNSNKITRITFFASNIPDFDETESKDYIISVCAEEKSYDELITVGSFVDLSSLKEVYIGYVNYVLLSNYFSNDEDKNTWFLHNTLRKSYTNGVPSVDGITIYVHEDLVDDYVIWENAGYTIVGITKGDTPPPPDPPTEDDDEYDADIDDPEGEEWPDDGGNGDISDEEDYIPPVIDIPTEEGNDNWIVSSDNNGFNVTIKQLGTPSINVYGCRLDLLNPTYYNNEVPLNTEIIDQFGNINFSALDNLTFNKVSNKTLDDSIPDDDMLKLYLGDYGNNFLIVFTVTGIDNFDATTKLFTSGVEYATHRESNWLKTEIVRIVKKPKDDINVLEDNVYYVVLLCTCLKLQNKDNYNCRNAIVSVNYGSQLLDSDERITTKIRVIQHKTELRLSNDTREINITDLDVLFCQKTERTTFTGNFFIGFPKNFWGNGNRIDNDGTSSNQNKLREYINDYFRILYDKEKIKVIGQKTNIGGLDYTYTFNVAEDKYANIKSEGSTTGVLTKFGLCEDKLGDIHEEYYHVNFNIENLKTTLAGGVWNISIYNICEPAEMLNIHVIEDQTDIPSIVLYPTSAKTTGLSYDGKGGFDEHNINTDNTECSDIRGNNYVAAECQLPVSITNMPIDKNSRYIFPNIETTDICIDDSAVFTCDNNNMVMSADEVTNNFNYALTINVKNNTSGVYSSFNMPISSTALKKQSLSAIKYKKTELNINPSIYNYDANSNIVVNACLSTNTQKITIERIGDKQESDILSNTGAFLYKINTGLSVIANTYTNYLTRTGNTITYMPIIIDDENNALVTIIKANSVNIENNLCFDHYYNEFIIYDEYCNILAPIYPYYNELNYTVTSSKTLQINEFVDHEKVYINKEGNITYYINDNKRITGTTYYCTATNNILIESTGMSIMQIQGYDEYIKASRHTGPAYKVFTANNSATPNIGVVQEVNDGIKSVKYTEACYGEHSYNGFSNATTVVELKPIYDVKVNSKNVSHYSTQIGNNDLENAPDNCRKHGAVIKVIEYADVIYDEKEVGLCYKDGEKYYNFDDREINAEIDIKPRFTNIEYTYFIYLNRNNINADGTFTISGSGATGYIGGININNSTSAYIKEDFDEIIGSRFYKIYNTAIDNADGKYTNPNALINNIDNDIYVNFKNNIMPKPTIEYNNYITESFNIADMHVNIYDIACNPNVFRQIFVNFSYNVNDNNTITKIYSDNSNGLILQTRMLNDNINATPTFTTGITLFDVNIATSATNIGFTPSIFKPQYSHVIKP